MSNHCDLMDCSPSGSSVHGILQARVLEWVAISFSRGSNPGLLHCRQIVYWLSYQGLLEKGNYSFKLRVNVDHKGKKKKKSFKVESMCFGKLEFEDNFSNKVDEVISWLGIEQIDQSWSLQYLCRNTKSALEEEKDYLKLGQGWGQCLGWFCIGLR